MKKYNSYHILINNTHFMKFMPAKGPVNVNRYTLYAIIPGLDTYAIGQLDKKKSGLIISVIFIAGLAGHTGIVMYDMANDPELEPEMDKEVRAQLVYEKFMPRILYSILIFLVIYIPLITYLMRKWAKQWNEKFDY